MRLLVGRARLRMLEDEVTSRCERSEPPDDLRALPNRSGCSGGGARGPVLEPTSEATFLAGVGRGDASTSGRGRFEAALVELACDSKLTSPASEYDGEERYVAAELSNT